MVTVFGLWDSETNNLVADFDTEPEALAYVAGEIAAHGHGVVESWALLRDDDAKTEMVAAGPDLAACAKSAPLAAH